MDFHLLEDIIFTMDLEKVNLVFTFIMLTIIWVLVVVICLDWVDLNLTYSRFGLTCSVFTALLYVLNLTFLELDLTSSLFKLT